MIVLIKRDGDMAVVYLSLCRVQAHTITNRWQNI